MKCPERISVRERKGTALNRTRKLQHKITHKGLISRIYKKCYDKKMTMLPQNR